MKQIQQVDRIVWADHIMLSKTETEHFEKRRFWDSNHGNTRTALRSDFQLPTSGSQITSASLLDYPPPTVPTKAVL